MIKVERVGVKCRLRGYQDSSHVKKRKGPETVTIALDLATLQVNWETLTNASLSTKLLSIKSALTTAQAETKKAQDQLVPIQ